ncbi:unnamed protein product, partial [Closterium sp. Naga37s-1]
REHMGGAVAQGDARRARGAAARRARAGLPAARVQVALPAHPPAHRFRRRHARAQAPHRPCALPPARERADQPAQDGGEAAAQPAGGGMWGRRTSGPGSAASSPYSSLAVKYGVKEPCGEALLFPLGDDKEENEREHMPLSSSLKGMTAAVYALAPDSCVRPSLPTHSRRSLTPTRCSPRPWQMFLFSTSKRETPGMYKVLSTTFRKDALFALVHESEKKVVAQFDSKLPSSPT